MATMFFQRYNVSDLDLSIFFLDNDLNNLPEIVKVKNLSFSGACLTVSNWDGRVDISKVAMKTPHDTYYFHFKPVWYIENKDETVTLGIKLIIPSWDAFHKWVNYIKTIDKYFCSKKEPLKRPNLKAPHASWY